MVENFAPRVGISPSTKTFSSKSFVWAPTRNPASLRNIAPLFDPLPASEAVHLLARKHKTKSPYEKYGFFVLAPRVGIEPTTNRLTGDRSTAELPRNVFRFQKNYCYINRKCIKNNQITLL